MKSIKRAVITNYPFVTNTIYPRVIFFEPIADFSATIVKTHIVSRYTEHYYMNGRTWSRQNFGPTDPILGPWYMMVVSVCIFYFFPYHIGSSNGILRAQKKRRSVVLEQEFLS